MFYKIIVKITWTKTKPMNKGVPQEWHFFIPGLYSVFVNGLSQHRTVSNIKSLDHFLSHKLIGQLENIFEWFSFSNNANLH